MAQTITDFREFLTDAKQIAAELSELEQSEAERRRAGFCGLWRQRKRQSQTISTRL